MLSWVAGMLGLAATGSTFAEVHLLPQPREARWQGEVAIPAGIRVSAPGGDAEDQFAANDLAQYAASLGESSADGYPVVLLRAGSDAGRRALAAGGLAFTPDMAAEGYALIVGPTQATILGETAAGVFYGAQTFKQMLPLAGQKPAIPAGTVRDWPAMKYRAIDDDLSRGPFPTLEFQKHQIQVLAAFKANIYSPYFEHTLEYPDQPLAAQPGSAMSPADVAELVRFAKPYHVDILPEQEAFGHLHQVLKYELYADVAETPHGHVLAPGQPGTLPLIKDWFTQIAAEFPSPFLHIGADETFDLGQGLTAPAVKERGYGPVYVDFLTKIHDELAPLHKRLLFWGDIGGADPAAVAKLPKDMIAVPWNYWDTKGFDTMIAPFAKAGIETWVAPGDANWSVVYPVARTAFRNIQGFIRDGQRLGSTGAMTTVWNDDGEGLFNQDWYGVLFGAVAAWQPGESSIPAYQAGYGADFHGDAGGMVDEAEQELMLANDALGKTKTGMDSDKLYWLDPWSAEGRVVSAKLLPQAHDLRIHAEKAIVLIEKVRIANPRLREQAALDAMDLGARRLDFIGMKWQLSQEMAEGYARVLKQQHDRDHSTATHNLLDEISSMFGRLQDLRDGYSATKNEYRKVWLGENSPYWLDNVLVRYDLQIEKWQERAMRFAEVIRMYENGKELPSAEQLGIPPA